MKYADWSTLKTANKVVFKKIAADGNNPEYTVIEKKVYNTDTGAESTVQNKMSLGELEREKTEKPVAKGVLEIELAEINKMITEVKAL